MAVAFFLAGCSSLDKANALLREGKNDEALAMAIGYLSDGDPQVRIQAIKLVARIGGEKAGEALMPLLNDENADAKIEAIKAIGIVGYQPAAKQLIEMMIPAKGLLFETIAGTISRLGTPAIDIIVSRMDLAATQAEKDQFRKFLVAIGPQVAEAVAKSMKGKSAFENEEKFQILIALKNPKTSYLLVQQIDDVEVGHLVEEGLVKLGSMSEKPVMEELQNRISDTQNKAGKEALIKVLGDLKAKMAIPLLEQLSKDPSDLVRAAADHALTKIRGF